MGLENTAEVAWYSDILIKLLVGMGQFVWGMLLIYISIRFHLWLMEKYKKLFLRDELLLIVGRCRAKTKIDIADAVLGVAAAVYQGAVFLAILQLMGNIQTPFG